MCSVNQVIVLVIIVTMVDIRIFWYLSIVDIENR